MYMIYLKKKYFFSLVTCFLLLFNFENLKSDEKINAIVDQIQVITKDLKTLEKAVYKESDITSLSNASNDTINEDVQPKPKRGVSFHITLTSHSSPPGTVWGGCSEVCQSA